MPKIGVVGAGPAGLSIAYNFAKKGLGSSIHLFDKGLDIEERISQSKPNLLCGLGGAGGFSDGKLNIHPTIGGNLRKLGLSLEESEKLVNKIFSELYCDFNNEPLVNINSNEYKISKLELKAKESDIIFKPLKQVHIGTDNLPSLLSNIRNYLIDNKINLNFNTNVDNLLVEQDVCKGLFINGQKHYFDAIVLAVGRYGQKFIKNLSNEYNLDVFERKPEVGVRIEVPHRIYSNLTSINYDPKLIFNINGKKFRTFCTNPEGFVVLEKGNDYFGVNGHTFKNKKSQNTNFAILPDFNTYDDFESSQAYVQHILKKISNDVGEKAIMEQLLHNKKRSIVPTLNQFYKEAIKNYWNFEDYEDILSVIEKLSDLTPEIISENTLIYFPEIKLNSFVVKLNENLQSSLKNLYFAGDCSGITGDILHSSAMGYLIGEAVQNEYK